MEILQATEEVSIVEAVALIERKAGGCSRSTLYRWMEFLSISPNDGFIAKRDLLQVVAYARAIKKTRNHKAALRAVAKLWREHTEDEIHGFVMSDSSTFISMKEALPHVS